MKAKLLNVCLRLNNSYYQYVFEIIVITDEL